MSKKKTAIDSARIVVAYILPKRDVPAERVNDLLCSAFEGGSNYWIASARRERFEGYLQDVAFNYDGAVFVKLQDEPEKGEMRLGREEIQRGLELFATKTPRHFGNWLDECDDASTGDVFLQLCLFGEVVYG